MCCKGALIFQEAQLVKELTGGCAMQNQKDLDFKAVPATACWGIENSKEHFGLGDKSTISAVFEAGTGNTKNNLLFCSS
jgi:hypothetical protein